ncbi:Trk system potassium transporter TrkA [Roseovarius atlanticus]|uniref:Trk system potassium transporter TrkA n=1 Tax=Roseovarius atlanticus TaxID=1641875 RepID=UPI001C95E99D|nr:Trk system potassium transporter TrkA [Roseovarius atlanticus]MBY5988792.1 Trk system potassium transporter TrkA [Roseovarius atlanticus]MBY6124183.1 Trk system potassium transporter TrkA [Roseovarius atlanticus]MBY6148678.1 Trk system potassium transporter TrkA [Roseovarius atlanticus]
MKVIICGAGQVGWQIARHLSGERNDVTVVDSNPDLVRRATETLDVQGINGFASYPNVLDQAGARDADMIIAATHSDEVNMVTCQVAHSVFSINRKIARLRSQSYLDAIYSDLYRRDHMPIDVVISPEREVAEAALQRLAAPAAFDTETFMEGKAQLLGLRIEDDCPIVNTPLRQLTDLFSTLEVVVLAIRRDGKLFAPEAEDQLFVGDDAYVFAPTEDVPRTMEVFGKTSQTQERLVIIGGGNIGLSVAKRIEKRGKRTRVKVIERDRRVAERAADALERTIVLNGDGLDAQLLAEANISRTDAVLAVTDDDKTNMLAAVRAKAEGCPFAIALINDPTLLPMMEPLGIDAYINPRSTTVSSILRHVRHGRVRSVYSIGDAEAEVIEAEVMSTSNIAGAAIREIDFPEGVLVGGVLRDGKVLKPSGTMRIEAGDVVVIFALASDVGRVEQLLQVSIDFF